MDKEDLKEVLRHLMDIVFVVGPLVLILLLLMFFSSCGYDNYVTPTSRTYYSSYNDQYQHQCRYDQGGYIYSCVDYRYNYYSYTYCGWDYYPSTYCY